MRVSEVMTCRVISVSPETSIRQALELMLKARISGLPVVDDRGKLVGVISEGDFLHRAEIGTERKYSPWYDALFGSGETATAYTRAHGLKVAEIMTNKVITTTGTSPLHKAVELMERHHIKRLPVMRGAQSRWNHPTRQSDARAGKYSSRNTQDIEERCRNPQPDSFSVEKTDVVRRNSG